MAHRDTVKLVIRLPWGLHRQLTRLAARKNQSLNSEMILALEEWASRNPDPRRPASAVVTVTQLNEKLDKLIALAEKEEKDEPK